MDERATGFAKRLIADLQSPGPGPCLLNIALFRVLGYRWGRDRLRLDLDGASRLALAPPWSPLTAGSIERRRCPWIAPRPEAFGVELVAEASARISGYGLDRDLVGACARGAAVAEQVVTLGVAEDAPADRLEGLGDGVRVLHEDVSFTADRCQRGLV